MLNHDFITGAGPLSLMADFSQRIMVEMDSFRKLEKENDTTAEKEAKVVQLEFEVDNEGEDGSLPSKSPDFDSGTSLYGTSLVSPHLVSEDSYYSFSQS